LDHKTRSHSVAKFPVSFEQSSQRIRRDVTAVGGSREIVHGAVGKTDRWLFVRKSHGLAATSALGEVDGVIASGDLKTTGRHLRGGGDGVTTFIGCTVFVVFAGLEAGGEVTIQTNTEVIILETGGSSAAGLTSASFLKTDLYAFAVGVCTKTTGFLVAAIAILTTTTLAPSLKIVESGLDASGLFFAGLGRSATFSYFAKEATDFLAALVWKCNATFAGIANRVILCTLLQTKPVRSFQAKASAESAFFASRAIETGAPTFYESGTDELLL
jgi:hypothetical protein